MAIGRFTYISVTVTANEKSFHSEGRGAAGFAAETDAMAYIATLPPLTKVLMITDTTMTDWVISRLANGKISEAEVPNSTRSTHRRIDITR